MLMKWIVCDIELEDRSRFSEAQEFWKPISRSPGFVAQFGGWDAMNSQEACILSLWKDQKSFDRFMSEVHDSITNLNSQADTYKSVDVNFFEPLMGMPGEFENLVEAVGQGQYLRVADCQVKAENIEHFCKSQQDIWIPGMKNSEGMLGGYFNRGVREPDRFLVTTLWVDSESHRKYSEFKVPKFRQLADVSRDLNSILGRFIKLVPEWLVLPPGK